MTLTKHGAEPKDREYGILKGEKRGWEWQCQADQEQERERDRGYRLDSSSMSMFFDTYTT